MKLIKSYCLIMISFMLSTNSFADIGIDTADDLNHRYNFYDECSYGGRAYDCSGIMIHTFDNDAESWYPTESGIRRGSVSFSWLRNDINIYKEGDQLGSIYGGSEISGIIFQTTERALISGKIPAEIYCAYGINGETQIRENYGCAMSRPNETIPNPEPNNNSSCSPLGILTSKQLVDKYFINKEGYFGNGLLDQCSFSANRNEFIEAMNVGPLVLDYLDNPIRNNEIVLKEWSLVKDENIPLNAFFYTTHYHEGELNALNKIKFLQEQYFNLTGIFIPIIEINMNIIRNSQPSDSPKPFIYNPEDQSISPLAVASTL
ncbi:TPA: hypothetical protein ACX6RV_003007 [Photobacterium damselae]